jgi:hypothetical protein
MTLPKVLICGKSLSAPFILLLITIGVGNIVWAHKDVEQMLGPIAEIVVRSVQTISNLLPLIVEIADGFALSI